MTTQLEVYGHKSWLGRAAKATALVLLMVAAAMPALADHSIGRPCIDCHTLRSTNVVAGSRNVKQSEVTDPLYNAEWYNPLGWPSNAANWPLDCSYCHSEDIGFEIKNAYGGKRGITSPGRTRTAVGSAHPVDVRGDEVYYPASLRITCNDCHNGPAGSPRITPAGLLSKSDTDGYPNHLNTVVSPTSLPGENDLANNPPSLTAPYGNDPGIWGKTGAYVASDMLCFTCHDASDSTSPPFSTGLGEEANNMVSIMAEYSMTGGGHNVQGIGLGIGSGGKDELERLPCFNCHDPHSGVAFGDPTRANEALITATAPGTPMLNPYETGAASPFTFDGYKTTGGVRNDRGVCLTCHAKGSDPQATIEGGSPVRFMAPITAGNLAYGFHTNAHAGVDAVGNCLQANGGCHQSPHNTSPYDCMGCHNSNLPNYSKFPAALKAVAHVNSDFGLDGFTADGKGLLNGIASRHDFTYDATQPLNLPANNGCLNCHNVPANQTTQSANLGKILGVGSTVYPGIYGGAVRVDYLTNTLSDRETLAGYNQFCLENCHGKDNPAPVAVGSRNYYPPQVNNQYDYYFKAGHGTGTGNENFASGNDQAKVPCLECHMYHGSTAYKLLPGNVETDDGAADPTVKGGKVVKGSADYNAPTLATKLSLGGVANSKKIDYRDYTRNTSDPVSGAGNSRLPDDKRRSFKYANYYGLSSPWSSYYPVDTNNSPPDPPSADRISFGTAGDRLENGDNLTTDGKVGFCNTCHLYKNTPDGTNQTAKWVDTHEGAQGYTAEFPSKRKFFKDCSECHDPHGSGDKASDIRNAYMVRGRVVTDTRDPVDGSLPKVFNVVFKGKTGIDSGDEYYSAPSVVDVDTRDNLCAVCHTATTHNIRVSPPTSPINHNSGGDCFLCHPHGDKDTIQFPGFPGKPVGGCNGCHGYPPQRLDTASRVVPPEENYVGGGGPHVEHVRLLADATGVQVDDYSVSPKVLCGPCHGEQAPEHTSGNSTGAWTDLTVRNHVNIGQRTNTGTTPTTSWGGSPRYGESPNGQLLPDAPATVMAYPAGTAMTISNSVCTNVDCHKTPTNPAELAWFATTEEKDDETDTPSTFNPQDSPKRTRICYDCHDVTPPDIRVYDYAGALVYGMKRTPSLPNSYDPKKINVAANYFGSVSTYGRGGHGDYRISQAGFDVNSSTRTITAANPIDCTACHKWTSLHFTLNAVPKTFRLRNPVLETNGHGNTGLCNQPSCHDGTKYPGTATGSSQADKLSYLHHPSFRAVPSALTKRINIGVDGSTTWIKASNVYSQSGYAPSDAVMFGASQLKEVDYFTDWYNRGDFWTPSSSAIHNQTEPFGAFLNVAGNLTSYSAGPSATLPLNKDITGDTGAEANYFLCVTCHNPHGTDLFAYDGSGGAGIGKDVADNNMLRLKADDNKLCVACH